MPIRPHETLRSKMREQGIDQQYLSTLMRRKGLCASHAHVSERMTGKRPWTLAEIYFIMDTLNIPYEEMHLYFPPNGKESADIEQHRQRQAVLYRAGRLLFDINETVQALKHNAFDIYENSHL